MDELTFSARRAREGSQRPEPLNIETRFKTLVQSPLRAGILRFLTARPGEAFDTETIMQAFGRMRQDVDNCVNELVDFGVVKNSPATATYGESRPEQENIAKLLELFLEGPQPTSASKESSPSVQRFREMIGRTRRCSPSSVDSHRRQVGHLGADPRADRRRQGSGSRA